MANDFILVTDSACDMPEDYLKYNEIAVMQLHFTIDDRSYAQNEMESADFYRLIREGKQSTTAQINTEDMKDFFEPFLREGKDVLYLAFSSGLSGTCQNGMLTASDLEQAYPDRKVLVVDSRSASMGQGLLLYKVNQQKLTGRSIEETAEYARNMVPHTTHFFTVDDLMHLHRGGRVSKASAVVGSMLGIKPMLHVDDEGHLIMLDKVRGRRQALENLVTKMLDTQKSYSGTDNDIFFVSHGDCEEDALYVAHLMQEKTGIQDYMIHPIGPVIGTHSGPGTVALFLMSGHR